MKNLTVVIFLLSCFGLHAQTRPDSLSGLETYVSVRNTFEIQYNPRHWQISNDSTAWEVEFHDVNNLVQVYFGDFNYYVPEKKLQETIKSQFDEAGKITNIKIRKKKFKYLEVQYFECDMIYMDYDYKYVGFFFSGDAGTMELQFAGQKESIERAQKLIEELCNGVRELKR